MSKKNQQKTPLSPYHLRSTSPSRIFEGYEDPNEEKTLLIILTTAVSRWKQKAPKQPWFMKPEAAVLARFQRLDKSKMLKKKPLAALQDDSVHYLNPTYIRWKHDGKGNLRDAEYSTDIKKFYREEIDATMRGIIKAKERLSSMTSYPKPPKKTKQSFLDVLYSKTTIEETTKTSENDSNKSSEGDESHMEEAQPDNIGIPPGGQEEFKTPDTSEDDQESTQEPKTTSEKPRQTVEKMLESMQTRIDTLEKTVQNQGFQYELAINKVHSEAPRNVKALVDQVEKASIDIAKQEKKIAALTQFKVEEFVEKYEPLITETTENMIQTAIVRFSNTMDQKHEEHRQLLVGEVQNEAVKISQTLKRKFESDLDELKTRIEEEHMETLIAQLDSYAEATVTAKDQEIQELWDAYQTISIELEAGDLFKTNRTLKKRMNELEDIIEKAGNDKGIQGPTEAVEDIYEEKLQDLKRDLESKIKRNDMEIDQQVSKSIEVARKADDTRLTSHAKMIEALKTRMTQMEDNIQHDESTEPTPPTSNETTKGRFRNQPAFIPGSATRNLFATPVSERAAAQLANDMATNMTTNVSKFEKATLHHDLHKATIDIAELEDYYENLQGQCRSYQIPLVPRDEIRNVRSCMPMEVSLMPAATQSIAKQALYNKINSSFTEEPVLLRNMITQNDEQDGYKVIYQIMSTFCQDLMDYPPTWGPPIDPNKDLWAYSKQLKRFRTQHGHKASYSDDEVAFEILQQAVKIPKYKGLAQSLMASYITTRQNNLDMTNFEKFAIISTLARIDMREPGTPPEDAIINKGYAKDDGTSRPYDNGPRGRYPPPRMAKNRVNCDACKTFGHNVPEQCCHFSAKLYHAQKYMEQHPEKAKTNAAQYEKRYDANIVKHMIANKTRLAAHLPPDQQDSYIDQLIDDIMADDYSSNDGISQLTGTTEQLSISTPSREQC